ncbi:MAG: alpha/beta hydrolase [Prolixibacteraceae bacterium]|nr:alpha/beta hydrolase [Prolixibacteraceae bacterium]MBN2775228.1 alpha/beta hydrolase [Prolixibacteraceae bacterium]
MDSLSYEKYTKPGHKQWIVFVHGAGGSSKTFGRQIAAFKKHFNLLLPDLQDHGNSKEFVNSDNEKLSFTQVARNVVKLLDELGINEAHFLGVSMGSLIIREIENMRPDLILSIVIGGGIMNLNRRTHLLFKTGVILSNFIPYHKLYQLVAWILMPYENHKVARRLFIREAKTIHTEAFKVWLGLLAELKYKLDLYFNIPLKKPTLMIMGGQDFAFLEHSIKYSKKFPFINLQILPKCGHVCNIEQADEFNLRSLEFLLALQSSLIQNTKFKT